MGQSWSECPPRRKRTSRARAGWRAKVRSGAVVYLSLDAWPALGPRPAAFVGSGARSFVWRALLLASRRAGLGQRRRRRSAQDDDWLAVFVLESSLHLGRREVHHDAIGLFPGPETQNTPVDRNLAAPDAEETAEIDHRGTHLTGTVDNDVDDAAHVFIPDAANFPAENRLHGERVENYG